MNYQESIKWLYSTQLFGIKLGLENVSRLLDETGVSSRPDGIKVIHVAGTNGKGSVCAFAERILRDAGVVTGLFTSPHLIRFGERIQVSGGMISEEAIAHGLSSLRELVCEWETHPTFFELSFVLAMRHFCDSGCEVILLETGMGGRLDATNAVTADVSVITSIALDHQEWLGDTLREIAGEKAGIIKPNTPVVVADLAPEARDVVGRRALTLRVPCIEAHPLPIEWELGLKGAHQRENAALAVEAACRVEGERLTQEGIQLSLKETYWPGRFEIIQEKIVLDGAHNPEAAAALASTWRETFSDKAAHLIFGAVELKDIDSILAALISVADTITLVPVTSERSVSLEVMREAMDRVGGQFEVNEVDCLETALEAALGRDGMSLVAGSLFLVGEARGLLMDDPFEVSLQ